MWRLIPIVLIVLIGFGFVEMYEPASGLQAVLP